jgi:hypothetical protein
MILVAQVCCRSIAGIAGSNPAASIDVCLVFVACCVDIGLCDGRSPFQGSRNECVCV